MAKKRKSKGKVEKELDTISDSVNSTLEQYDTFTPKSREKAKKKYDKKYEKVAKRFDKTRSATDMFQKIRLVSIVNKLEDKRGKGSLYIDYGGIDLYVNPSYLKSVKNKEHYLDSLYNRTVSAYLRNYPVPTETSEATELEGLITKYSKKLKGTEFYNPNLVENNINKLTNFRNQLNDYEYSDYIEIKKDIIYDEINDYENGDEISDYYEELTGEEEEIYKAVEQPLLIDGILVGMRFNFF